ncbi:S-DNA-T family DNA segregation ATPase FtsK/SpoIIIE [Rhizobium leguminosarum]|uniref:S-DNA-T family DNA segregation ATPase FtsK/SpoIIIE n=1 Tax=Rhizobium leguminosarum TaxID=384 RepID=A0AAE2MQ99_RHILE|nr:MULTISPECIES: DNA translocase FtsK [Rhizobium]MBB4293394.1 S-DNA-T family DNA segregation ATPase FtsK/SpoIIIE [Rhizobium leguminosarum]MBB4295995.1 S-DNA-T family DNA segregation ATPase FtsK/SpoIIIE [Rhizobium leguminosarum]MBB4311344.1 S-DNA-T family DNA segregation ATPase FtsK/SpoIIIE [Rhizobium leguminosarum]MBB4420220.1 S-DNA-T family DNA segregation ATPase FtsK/SpoIIIE [Rhizobium leguminosarum]MBB4435612.1 S-DNA-T family DNA segregation ATPase FtsK/SpoIIIE [Rhizobium esperanzae]
MRFPRTNLTDAGDFSSGIEAELPEVNPGEKPAAPIWQSNFSLAPNVRFTRTPETLISKRRGPNEPVRDDSQIGQQAIRIEPVAVDVPFDIYLPEPDEISPAPVVELQPPPLADEAVAPAFRATAELSSISDFAFWEVMAFEEAEPVRAPPLISFPKAETSPESITSLFRIMEWRPGRPAPAPVVSRPAPPPAVSAKVAIRPPVAPSLEKPRRIAVEAPVVPASQAIQAPPIAPAPQIAWAPQVSPPPQRTPPVAAVLPSPRLAARPERVDASGYEFPPRALLQEPPERLGEIMSQETLEQNAGLLESVLEDFGIKGEIIHVRPGPVVTLYEFEPAPGVKSSRVIGLADDIARSMSALSARVAVVPGRNVIGIELPNVTRETVYFREMIESQDFEKSGYKLALGLGKTIGGEPVIAELAKMPHLLVAGTTGSGKSVAINTMILSLLYRMTPEQCRLIMVDPKMLELSVYDGIPHLLTPVVTDPKKAVMALKWAVREMEERYRKMSRLGVRNIDGYNDRVAQARDKGETIHVMVQVGFDRSTGVPIEENQALDLTPMPYIVVIVDEMADLMMVAGKEIEGAIQRLAQMARAAGIHLIMATQRPSVDVITGTIKANFPTRISFQVTSKIDSRTILGEQGAEQLLGQGDMLHMQGGGRISRVHGPFVSDLEVEKVVAHLKTQGRPEYLDTVTADEEEETEEEEAGAVFDKSAMASEDGNELYEQAVKVVMRDKKCSTSYIQRRLGIGYNRAASLVERMEKEGLVGPANHVGKREIVSGRGDGD